MRPTLSLPQEYPFAPPALRMMTPSGRFESNKSICPWSISLMRASLSLTAFQYVYRHIHVGVPPRIVERSMVRREIPLLRPLFLPLTGGA